jgi:hypothetical protein
MDLRNQFRMSPAPTPRARHRAGRAAARRPGSSWAMTSVIRGPSGARVELVVANSRCRCRHLRPLLDVAVLEATPEPSTSPARASSSFRARIPRAATLGVVVDPDFRIRGMANLCVCDASEFRRASAWIRSLRSWRWHSSPPSGSSRTPRRLGPADEALEDHPVRHRCYTRPHADTAPTSRNYRDASRPGGARRAAW